MSKVASDKRERTKPVMLDDLRTKTYTGVNRRPRRSAACMWKGGVHVARLTSTIMLAVCVLGAGCQPVPTPAAPSPTPVSPQPTSTSLATLAFSPSPLPSATSEPDLPASSSSLEQIQIDAPDLQWPLIASVYLPAAYAEEPDEQFPVLYLLHGLLYTNTQWIELGVPAAADDLFAAGESTPYIIVMPWEHNGTDFEAILIEHLIPSIDAQYRTQRDGAARAIGGLSRGGGWAIRIGLHFPEQFASIGLHSPANFTSAPYFDYWLRGVSPDNLPRISIDIGERDTLRESTEALAASLDLLGIPYTYSVAPGEHNAAYWSSHLREYLRWYGAPWTCTAGTALPTD